MSKSVNSYDRPLSGLRVGLQLFAASIFLFAACHRRFSSEVATDSLLREGVLRMVVKRDNYTEPLIRGPGGPPSKTVSQDFFIVKMSIESVPLYKPEIISIKAAPFRTLDVPTFMASAARLDGFWLSSDSEMLIHHLDLSKPGCTVTFFDVALQKDTSAPFPVPHVSNRSRSAAIAVLNGRTSLLDLRSPRRAAPQIICFPPWEELLDNAKSARLSAVLTDDTQFLVLLPNDNPQPLISNVSISACFTNGAPSVWSVPVAQNWETLVDCERIDGKLVVLSRGPTPTRMEDFVRLSGLDGTTISSNRIPAGSDRHIWDPGHTKILYPTLGTRKTQNRFPRTFVQWDYGSNTVRQIAFP